VRVLEDDLGAMHVGFDRVHRLLDDQLPSDGGGEMKDDVAAVDELRQERLVVHRVDEGLEPGASLEVRDVVDRTGREGVENEDLVAVVQQRLGQMGADEPGAPRDQCPHADVSVARIAAATRSSCSFWRAGYSGSDTT